MEIMRMILLMIIMMIITNDNKNMNICVYVCLYACMYVSAHAFTPTGIKCTQYSTNSRNSRARCLQRAKQGRRHAIKGVRTGGRSKQA